MRLPRIFTVLAMAVAGTLAATAQQSAPPAEAGDVDVAMLKKALSDDRRTLFRAGMNLPAKELEAFWSIYADYEKERDALADQRLSLLTDFAAKYQTMGDADASSFVSRAADSQAKEIALRKKFADRVAAKVSGRAAARFWQIDDYISTAVRLDILDDVPLVRASE